MSGHFHRRLCGYGGEDSESDDERAFNNKPAWARALVIAAGPVMNFILAVVVLGVMITYMGTSLSPVLCGCDTGNAGL